MLIRRFLDLKINRRNDADDDSRTIQGVVVSDDSVDSWGTRVDPKGWDLSRYTKNPALLWHHSTSHPDFVLGNGRNVRVDGNELIADLEFEEAGASEFTDKVFGKVKRNLIRGMSVGFMPLAHHWEDGPGSDLLVFDKQQLIELSVVPLGANENAVMEEQRSFFREQRSGNMLLERLIKLLGKEGTEDEIFSLIVEERQVFGTLFDAIGAKSHDEALGKVRALMASEASLKELAQKAERLEQEKVASEREILLRDNRRKFTPAELDGWVQGASVEQLRAFVASAPDRFNDTVSEPQPEADHLSETDRIVAKRLGIDEDKFIATKKGMGD